MNQLATALVLSLAGAPAAQAMPGEFATGASVARQLSSIKADALVLRASVAAAKPAPAPAPTPAQYAVRGMDVSHYQGAIQWDKVAGQGLSFVYMKATEGDDTSDDAFQANWEGASAAGLSKGAYHFYNLCGTGAAQADWFIKTVPVEVGALPPAIDLEASKACKKLPTKKALQKELAAFVAKVQAAYGKVPVLYVNSNIYDRYFAGEAADNPFWISDTDSAPALSDQRDWAIWQHTFKGQVAGISGRVDLDVFSGNSRQLAALSGSGTMLASR